MRAPLPARDAPTGVQWTVIGGCCTGVVLRGEPGSDT